MMRRVLVVLLVLFCATPLFARIGGGDSYSGGGSSSGGGGGDGGGAELIFYVIRFLFWLTLEHPAVGIPVDIVVICGVVVYVRKKNKLSVFTVSSSPGAARAMMPAQRMDALRRFDPNFSEITFTDFCYSLYARAHHARGAGDLDRYAPYLSAAARNALRANNPKGLTAVKGVVIGSLQVAGVQGLDTSTVLVNVTFESNYTESSAAGELSWYVREQWALERGRDILSPPPEKSKADHCPRCGAALKTRTDGACEYCGVKIENGAFQWFVRGITLMKREARGPLLTSNVPEQGTERPTIYQQRFGEHRAAFEAAHPRFDWTAFEQRVREIAIELQNAWTARDWERVRPLETESLFQTHRYWIDAYLQQRLRNVVEDFTIERVQPVKIDADAFYEAITVRLHAHGRDFTLDESGQVVAGSRSQVRRWTEYWTLIRTLAVAGGTKRACPNCGAEVAVGATGICEYCGGKLTAGSFDWVLSKIEQDEAYRG